MFIVLLIISVLFAASVALAEQHSITFNNLCGHGTPQLIENGKVVSNGGEYTKNGAFSGIAYLQTGKCLFNGEGCALVETTLINPACPGCGSSTDISLIQPHALNVPVKFEYTTGTCANTGATCTTPNCHETAFFISTDTQVQVACQEDNADLKITFCPGQAGAVLAASLTTALTSATHHPTTSTSSSRSSATVPTTTLHATTVYRTHTVTKTVSVTVTPSTACNDAPARAHPRDFSQP